MVGRRLRTAAIRARGRRGEPPGGPQVRAEAIETGLAPVEASPVGFRRGHAQSSCDRRWGNVIAHPSAGSITVEAGLPLTRARIGSGAVGWRSRVRGRYRLRWRGRGWTPGPGTVPVADPGPGRRLQAAFEG